MNPISAAGTDQTAEQDQTFDGGCSREELMALLQEGLDSGVCEDDFDTVFKRIYFEHFGSYPIEEHPAVSPGRT